MTQRAQYETKVAPLSGDWGLRVATEKFGAELLATFPVYTRGPRKGKLKGALCWTACTVGGWSRNPPGGGRATVLRPGTYDWHLTLTPDDANGSRVAEWDRATGARVLRPASEVDV